MTVMRRFLDRQSVTIYIVLNVVTSAALIGGNSDSISFFGQQIFSLYLIASQPKASPAQPTQA